MKRFAGYLFVLAALSCQDFGESGDSSGDAAANNAGGPAGDAASPDAEGVAPGSGNETAPASGDGAGDRGTGAEMGGNTSDPHIIRGSESDTSNGGPSTNDGEPGSRPADEEDGSEEDGSANGSATGGAMNATDDHTSGDTPSGAGGPAYGAGGSAAGSSSEGAGDAGTAASAGTNNASGGTPSGGGGKTSSAAGKSSGGASTGGKTQTNAGAGGSAAGSSAAGAPGSNGGKGGLCENVVAQHPITGAEHLVTCSPVEYETNPPCEGNHYDDAAAFGTYDDPIPMGFVVHSLEHGGIALFYNCPDGCKDEVARAVAWMDNLPEDVMCVADGIPRRILLVPDPALTTRWAASAWGWTLNAPCFDEAALTQFYKQHYDKAPEVYCRGTPVGPTSCPHLK